MITLFRYVISIVIWAIVALVLLLTGKVIYLMFWGLLGVFLVVLWVGHMLYKFIYLFNPDFKAIKIVLAFLVLIALGVGYFKFFVRLPGITGIPPRKRSMIVIPPIIIALRRSCEPYGPWR